jgi:hypothetical protein
MMAMSAEEREVLKNIEISVAKIDTKFDNFITNAPTKESCARHSTKIELMIAAVASHFWWLCGLTAAMIAVILYVLTGKIIIP